MSYDFTLFKLEPGQDVHTVLNQRELALAEQPHTRLIPALDTALTALVRQHSGLAVFRRGPDVELDSSDNNGIQILFAGDEVSMSVPYWHEGATAEPVFREIWSCLRIIQNLTGFIIYDPQLGRAVDLNADFDLVLSVYGTVVG